MPDNPLEVSIDVARGEVLRKGRSVRVSEGTRQLLTRLAVGGKSVQREILIDDLWPDLDGDRAANALKVCVHRARIQLADMSSVIVSQGVVSLGEDVTANYAHILSMATASGPLTEVERQRVEDTFESLVIGLTLRWAPWNWFLPYRDRLIESMHSIGARLIEYELARDNPNAAVHIVAYMANVDPFDEKAKKNILSTYERLKWKHQNG